MRDTSGRLATVQCPHLIVFAILARLFTDLADVAALHFKPAQTEVLRWLLRINRQELDAFSSTFGAP
jgi:hypothetical protein